MKRTIITLMAAAVCLCASANVSASESSAEIAAVSFRAKKEIKTVVFSAHLHCKNCVKKVEENIAYEKGVEDLKVSLENQTITVTYDASKTSVEKLAAAIGKLGYPAKVVDPKSEK